jgi:hypothetical protein
VKSDFVHQLITTIEIFKLSNIYKELYIIVDYTYVRSAFTYDAKHVRRKADAIALRVIGSIKNV